MMQFLKLNRQIGIKWILYLSCMKNKSKSIFRPRTQLHKSQVGRKNLNIKRIEKSVYLMRKIK